MDEIDRDADLAVLDKNIFELPTDQIVSAELLFTLLQGGIVYNVDVATATHKVLFSYGRSRDPDLRGY